MNIRKIFNVTIIILAASLAGCASPKEKSAKTGWNINDPKWGGFQVVQSYEQQTPPGMVFIEGGSFVMGNNQADLGFDYHAINRRVSVSSFYMDETPVRNVDYKEYVYWLERIYGQDYPEVVRNAEPDELCWRRPDMQVEHMVDYYFRTPAFDDYPVVGVSWEQAMDYCAWRTDRANEQLLVRLGYFQNIDPGQTADNHFNTAAYFDGQYVGIVKKTLPDMNPTANEKKRNIQLKDGILMPNFRLPTEAEWEYAAYGLIGNSYDERVIERRIYPWSGDNVRMSDAKNMGRMRANFVRGRGDFMGIAGALNDGGDYTSSVYTHPPNDYGLYDMAGNVSEWTSDVYRPLTFEDAYGMNPFRGNEYKTVVREEDGRIAERDSLGRIRYRPVTEEEVANRRNYQRADNRNYRDGDFASTISSNWDPDEAPENPTLNVYDPRSSLITDYSRVIKGGNWTDRAYWLSPGNRRFLDQSLSEAWIGFRCVAPRIGPSSMPAGSRRR
jgi:gliding motility-associated lipoprotein GldJ